VLANSGHWLGDGLNRVAVPAERAAQILHVLGSDFARFFESSDFTTGAILAMANVREQPWLWVVVLPLSLPLTPFFERENPLSIKD